MRLRSSSSLGRITRSIGLSQAYREISAAWSKWSGWLSSSTFCPLVHSQKLVIVLTAWELIESPSYTSQLNESICTMLTSFLQALNYHPEGRRRAGYSWKAAKTIAKKLVGWRVLVGSALSSPGGVKNLISMFFREVIWCTPKPTHLFRTCNLIRYCFSVAPLLVLRFCCLFHCLLNQSSQAFWERPGASRIPARLNHTR